VRHGEVWAVNDPAIGRLRVAVLSSDGYNEARGAWPFCAPIVRRADGVDAAPYVVALADPDPLGGLVVVARMRRLPHSAGTQCEGMLTGASMGRLGEALRDLFEV
jgi:mRNA interferase MazF